MSSFERFKKSVDSSRIAQSMAKSQEKKSYDDGSWKIEADKETGSAEATIRFLPPKDGDIPYEVIFSHFFKGDDGSWCVVDRCGRTFGETCPICEANKALWATGREADQNVARNRKARKNYLFNIYVVDDKRHPENNGKVFPFKAGPSIFNMVMDAMKEDSEFDEEPKRPFDLYSGHNFILRIRKEQSKSFPTYDKSKFVSKATPLASTDEELEKIYNSMVDLKEFANRGRLSIDAVQEKAAKAYCGTLNLGGSASQKQARAYEALETPKAAEKSYTAGDALPWDEPVQQPSVKPSEISDDDDTFWSDLEAGKI